MEDKKPKNPTQTTAAQTGAPATTPPSPPPPSEPAEFASKHVRSNIAPIFFIIHVEKVSKQG